MTLDLVSSFCIFVSFIQVAVTLAGHADADTTQASPTYSAASERFFRGPLIGVKRAHRRPWRPVLRPQSASHVASCRFAVGGKRAGNGGSGHPVGCGEGPKAGAGE